MAIAKNDEITVTGSEKEIRVLLRKAIDRGIAMMPYERDVIEDEFLRLARLRMRKAVKGAAEVATHG